MIGCYLGRIRQDRYSMYFLASTLLKRSRFCQFLIIKRDSYKLRFCAIALFAACWPSLKERVDDEIVISVLLSCGETFVNVRANTGVLTICAAAKIRGGGRAYSSEPHPRILKCLKGNIRLNRFRQIHVFRCALSDIADSLRFTDERANDINRVVNIGTIVVDVIKLDDVIVDTEETIALVKIDGEGYELPVLRGARRTLRRTRAVYFESWEEYYRSVEYSTVDVIGFLNELKFDVFYRSDVKRISLPVSYVSDRCENPLALHNGYKPRDFGL